MTALPKLEPSHEAHDFIDKDRIHVLLGAAPPPRKKLDAVLAKSLAKEPLDLEECAILLNTEDPEDWSLIFGTARKLKETVYGNRVVLFAPLYLGNECVNDCRYCSFRRSNTGQVRKTLDEDELRGQVNALTDAGHKRLILVFGEHPRYDAHFIADTVRRVYAARKGPGEIRRVNINAAPLDLEGYRLCKEAGIGTYQIFQETYHRPTYERVHPQNTRKGDFVYRLDGLDRAMQGGCDDVGIGALFGLYDWRFEVMGLVSHARHLMERFGVGCHTISFPRLRPAHGVSLDEKYQVSDEEMKRIIAVLRLAVPYTGLILTAREEPELRRELMSFGVSQIDAGSRIEIGGYTDCEDTQQMEREQFSLGDVRPLDEVMGELMEDGYLPSFCTACYRLGRTGEHFMEFAIPGFIKRFCTPNALLTLAEYLEDYASEATRLAGLRLIEVELDKLQDATQRQNIEERLRRIRERGDRDLYY